MQVRMSNGQPLFDSVQATWNLLEQSAGVVLYTSSVSVQEQTAATRAFGLQCQQQQQSSVTVYTPQLSAVEERVEPTITHQSTQQLCPEVLSVHLC